VQGSFGIIQWRMMMLLSLCQFLLIERRVHVFLAAAVGQSVTSSAPRSFDCIAASIAVMPPPMTTTLRLPISSCRQILGLAQDADKIDGVENTISIFAIEVRVRIDAGQTDAKETPRRNRAVSCIEHDIAARAPCRSRW
jgi:hypothetical protein